MAILSDLPTALIWVDDDLPVLGVTWRGEVTAADFRATLESVLVYWQAEQADRLVGRQPLVDLLQDTWRFTTLDTEEQVWAATDWLPRAVAAGVRRIAYVMPEDTMGRVAVMGQMLLNTQAVPELESVLLPSIVAAHEWLRPMSDE